MYLLEVSREDGSCFQGFVSAEWPLEDSTDGSGVGLWAGLFSRSVAQWRQLNTLSAALRVECIPDKPIRTVYAFVVPADDEHRLRMVLAAYLRTDGIGSALTTVPYRDEDLDERFVHPGAARFTVRHDTLETSNGAKLLHNFFLADHLADLVDAGRSLGVPFAYELQAAPWSVPRDTLREILYQTTHLAASSGVPNALISDQVQLGERMKKATFHVEESIAVARNHAVVGARDLVARLITNSVYADYDAEPGLVDLSDEQTRPFANHVHSQVMFGAPETTGPEYAASALSLAQVQGFLSCNQLGIEEVQSEQLPAAFLPPSVPGEEKPHRTSAFPVAARASGGFVFVSYARVDGDRVFPVIDALVDRGLDLWVDRKIVGGDEWIAELEARIVACAGVLAFVSPNFGRSRYCRREVQYADALGKSIILVLVKQTELQGGLGFILSGRQFVQLSKDGREESLVSALNQHMEMAIRAK